MSCWDSNGLLNTRDGEEYAENSMLFTYEYILLTHMVGDYDPSVEVNFLNALLIKNKIGEGLYKDHPTADTTLPLDDQMLSHDTLTAMMGASYLYGCTLHKEVWKEIKRQKLGYNNLEPNGERFWRHPRDLIYYGILNNNIICWLLFPLFALMNIISMFNSGSTGKILLFVRYWSKYNSLPFRLLYMLCSVIINLHPKFGSWKKVFNTYYTDLNHPVNLLAEKAWK